MKRNIFRIGFVLLVFIAFTVLYADLTMPIKEGETDHAPSVIEYQLDGSEVKDADISNPNFNRREELWGLAYRHHYNDVAQKFPDLNFDIRNISITRRSWDSKNKKTTFSSNARVVLLPEGTFTEAKLLTRPITDEEKEFIKGAISGDFRLEERTLHYVNVPHDARVWSQAYTTLVYNAQAQYGSTADVKNIKVEVKSRESNTTTYTANAMVIVK